MPGETIDPKRIGIMDWDIYNEAAKYLREDGFLITDTTEKTMIDVILTMDKTIEQSVNVRTLYDIIRNQIKSARDEELVNGVGMYIEQRGHEPLNNDDVSALLAYRDEFEASGQNVWDGTRDEHYGKWMMQRRTPRDTADEERRIQKIERIFSYQSPKPGQPEKYEVLRNKAKELAYLIHDMVPPGEEQDAALMNLRQTVMWSNAGIACNE